MLLKNWFYKKILVSLSAISLLLCGCSEALEFEWDKPVKAEQCKVAISVPRDGETKSAVNSSATGFVWLPGDKISVWAQNSAGTYTFSNQIFNIYERTYSNDEAYFTSTLSQPMAAGQYSYYICYPVPNKVNGTNAEFTIPQVQDGKASGGVDVTLSSKTTYSELKSGGTEWLGINPVPAQMHHLLHFLRFYIPKGANVLGEPVRRIELKMPKAIVGTLSVDVTSASTASLSGGKNTIVLDLAEPLTESDTENVYAVEGILPPSTAYGSKDFLEVTLFSDTKMAELDPISLNGRSFQAGHVTGVKMLPNQAKAYFEFSIHLTDNHLGQDVKTLTMTLPSDTSWPDSESNVYTFSKANGGLMVVGDTILIRTNDATAYRAMSGKQLTVSYESEDAIVSQSVTMPNLQSINHKTVDVEVPYLLFQDFSGITADFHSYDEHSNSNPESKSGYEIIAGSGWYGARVGGKANTAIRISAHREFIANYPARCDSPFLTGLKNKAGTKAVKLRVQYNYSMNREEGPLDIDLVLPRVGLQVYLGYSTKSGAIASGVTNALINKPHGTFGDYKLLTNETGDYNNINEEEDIILENMGNDRRITWKTDCEFSGSPTNSTCHLYLDNIRVSIAK